MPTPSAFAVSRWRTVAGTWRRGAAGTARRRGGAENRHSCDDLGAPYQVRCGWQTLCHGARHTNHVWDGRTGMQRERDIVLEQRTTAASDYLARDLCIAPIR